MTSPRDRPLRILYRSYGGDNDKGRPPYYSKALALASLLRAVEALPVRPELVFVNDGVIPRALLEVMERHGEIQDVRRGGSNPRSYREMLRTEAGREGHPEDVVWLAEDDYLYTGNALTSLAEGVRAQPGADYFMLYGSRALDVGASRGRRAVQLPEPGADSPAAAATEVAGVRWYRSISTTSTFGVRRRALREDLRLLLLAPYTGGAWDNTTCLAVQGFRPFEWSRLREDLLPFRTHPPARWGRSVARGAVRLLATPLTIRPARRRRVSVGSDPELVLHMETGDPPHGTSTRTARIRWESVAAETADWARQNAVVPV